MQLNMFFFRLLFSIKFPLQTEKNGYYCFLIFHYMKCKLNDYHIQRIGGENNRT